MIGDIVGKPGRRALRQFLPGLCHEYNIDFVVANGENAAGGLGTTLNTTQEILDAGVTVITTGNHVWAKKEIIPYLDSEMPIIRPLNFPPSVPGRGYIVVSNVMVVNLIGRVFMGEYDCPFRGMDAFLAEHGKEADIILVDFHAEATSEKVALGRYLDGRVSAVVGTHTHIGTIDCRILPGGTAYVSDIGMSGPVDSIIGDNIGLVLQRFLTRMPHRLSVGEGKAFLDAVLLDIDSKSGRATAIERIRREEND